MARSAYIYVVHDGTTGRFVGAWTVKWELARWIATSGAAMIEVLRSRDGDPGEAPVALNPSTLEPAI